MVLKLASDDVLRSKCNGLTKYRLIRADTRALPEAGEDAALDEDTWWHRGLLWLPDLDQGKGD